MKNLARFGIPAAALASPWFIWNLTRFGTIWQDSGRVLAFRTHAMNLAGGASLGKVVIDQAKNGFYGYFLNLIGGISLPVTVAIIGFGLGFAVCSMVFGRRAKGKNPWILHVFTAASWGFYILYFWQQKFWYFPAVDRLIRPAFSEGLGAYFENTLRDKGRWAPVRPRPRWPRQS